VIKYNNVEPDLWSLYLYALKSPVTREKYQKRLERFFDFLGPKGANVEVKSRVSMELRQKEGSRWVLSGLLSFLQFNLARLDRKEITGATVRNYLKSIKPLRDS
jgi:hypothetical protein